MDKAEYLNFIDSEVRKLLRETTLSNFKNQIFAWRLNANFNRSFRLDYLWNRAIYLSSNCALLLQNDGDIKIVTTGLKTCAEIFEYLSQLEETSEVYDKDHLLILSALCYDLSGYQANAYCIATKIDDFYLSDFGISVNLDEDNYIIQQVKNVLLKKLPLAQSELPIDPDPYAGISLFNDALKKWFDSIFRLSDEGDYLEAFEQAYRFYLHRNNVFISQILFLFKARIAVYNTRSIWLTLKDIGSIAESETWRKYIKLLAFDYYSPGSIKDIEDRKSIYELWTSQLRAVQQGLLDQDENFVVQMPTSAGKTFIAELSILKHLDADPSKKCIYIAPFRALTSEKEIELSKYFSKLGYSVSALSGSYEIDSFQDVIISQTDLLIATPEKIDLLLRVNPEVFNNVSLMVIDEGHIIGDLSFRSSLLEFLMIRLKMKLPQLSTLFISAVMPPENANEYSQWLSGNENNVLRSLQFTDSPATEEWEPTRKLIGSFTWGATNGILGFKNFEGQEMFASIGSPFVPNYIRNKEFANLFPEKGKKPQTTAALAFKMSEEGNTLVFCAQPRYTETVSKPLIQIINALGDDIPEWFEMNEDKESYYYAKMWYGADHYISESIKRGIGIHFGDMPEQVRNSVEHDYRSGKLRILLSSNTIGQGLNFPIKNLIFYSLQIGHDGTRAIYISKRDFWNIVGRAGRAEKETEGQIIFVINTDHDGRLYTEFTNRDNLEEADSFIYKVISAFHKDRISETTKNEHIEILSETFLLDLFTEEVVGTDYEEVINDIIDNSLFKVQIQKKGLKLKPVRKAFRKIFRKFEDNLTPEQVTTYKLSGFSYDSNVAVDTFVQQNLFELQAILDNDDHIAFLRIIFDFILSTDIQELHDNKLISLNLSVDTHFHIIELWVNGTSLEEIILQWKEIQDIADFHLFLARGLFYLYPWAITSFLNILAFRLNLESDEIPDNIKNLSSYLKYGLNDVTGCLARSIGIKNRDVVNILLPLSNYLSGSNFIKWLSNLSALKIRNLEISEFDKENILSVSRRLTPQRFNIIPNDFTFVIEGTEDSPYRSRNSQSVLMGAELSYRRRASSQNDDPYAIQLLYNRNVIGKIPSEYSKMLSAEIDINEAEFLITVIDIDYQENFNVITVELYQIN